MSNIISLSNSVSPICPVGWGCRIHWLLLCRGVKTPLPSKCPEYDTKQSDDAGALGIVEYPFIATALLWPGVVAPNRVLSMGQIELNCVLKLNWFVWTRTVFWHWNCVLMLNWFVWTRTVFWHWNCVLMLNWIAWNRTVFDIETVYLCWT